MVNTWKNITQNMVSFQEEKQIWATKPQHKLDPQKKITRTLAVSYSSIPSRYDRTIEVIKPL
jgi:hypothetical protein